MEISAEWWLWVVFGLVLIGLEVVTPAGFYLVFFGLAAIIVGLLAAFGLFVQPLAYQLLLFTVLGLAALLAFRRSLVNRMRPTVGANAEIDRIVGEVGVALNDLAPDTMGQIELRGTAWQARNVGAKPIVQGERCRVDQVHGLTLHVRPLTA